MMRRLGRRWQRLHRLIYPAAALAVLHYWKMLKHEYRQPLLYAAILALLLGSGCGSACGAGARARYIEVRTSQSSGNSLRRSALAR